MAILGNILAVVGGTEGFSANTKHAWLSEAATASFTADRMFWNGYGPSGAKVRLAIYSDNSGSPNALLGYTEEITLTGSSVALIHGAKLASPVSITSGNYYWLALICDSGITAIQWPTGQNSAYNSDTYSDGFSDPFGSASTNTYAYGIIATDANLLYVSDLDAGGAVLTNSSGDTMYAVSKSGMVLILSLDANEIREILATASSADMFGGGGIGHIDAAIDASNVIHVVAAGSTEQTRDVAYNTWTPGGTGWGTWEEAAGYTEEAPSASTCWVSLSLDSNDVPHLVFADRVKVAGSTQDNVYYVNRIGGSWGNLTQIGVRSTKTDYYRHPELTMRNSDYREALYFGFTATYGSKMWSRSYTGTWGSETQVDENEYGYRGMSVVATTSGGVYRHFASYPTLTNIFENTTDTGYDASSAALWVSSALDDSDTRYVFYIDNSQDIHLISNAGSGWTDEGALQAGTFERVIAEWAYNNENQSGEINYIYGDGTYVYFDSFSLEEEIFPPVPGRVHKSMRNVLLRL